MCLRRVSSIARRIGWWNVLDQGAESVPKGNTKSLWHVQDWSKSECEESFRFTGGWKCRESYILYVKRFGIVQNGIEGKRRGSGICILLVHGVSSTTWKCGQRTKMRPSAVQQWRQHISHISRKILHFGEDSLRKGSGLLLSPSAQQGAQFLWWEKLCCPAVQWWRGLALQTLLNKQILYVNVAK